MKKKQKYNFKGRPDRACSTDESRPAMNYILIDDNYMVATNGVILVKIPLDFSELIGDTGLLDGYLIHRQQYIELLRYDIVSIAGEGELKAMKNTGLDSFSATLKLKHRSKIDQYPNYKSVIDYSLGTVGQIGVSKGIIKKFLSCFDGLDVNRIVMKFQAQNKAIHLHSADNDNVFGILMPVMLVDL